MADKTGYIGRNPGDSSVKVARQTFTPSTSTTDFTFASTYTVGYLDLYLNGARLIEGTDFNANDGITISMVSAAADGDVLEAVAYKAFNVGDSSSSSTGNFTVGNDLIVSNDASVSNDLNVTGIGTIGQGFNVTAGGANISGVVTATSYKGDGSALTGIAATDTIAAASLTVSGISTFTGVVKGLSDVRVTGNLNAGITTLGAVTVTSITGDGSGLTGVANTDVVHTREITATGVSTYYNDIQLQNGVGVGNSVTWDASAQSLLFKDNVFAKFGDGNDLKIYHDGANSYITEEATGNLKITSSGAGIELQKSQTEYLGRFLTDGAVELYYDNTKRIETTLTGAKTTGVSSCTSHCMPTADVGADLGSTTNRWANIYTNDLQLSNEGSQNEVDGTWGKYTIQEGEDDLFLINRRTGKKYKFMLEEVQ